MSSHKKTKHLKDTKATRPPKAPKAPKAAPKVFRCDFPGCSIVATTSSNLKQHKQNIHSKAAEAPKAPKKFRFHFNDDKKPEVVQSPQDRIGEANKNAYMLFYVRRGPILTASV